MLFLVPAIVFLAGGALAFWCVSRYRSRIPSGNLVIALACLLVAVTALAANSAQPFYDLGLSYEAVRYAEDIALFVFAFSLVGTWTLIYPARKRWWLLIAVPIGLAQPLLSALTLFAWSINGFAP